MKRLLTAISLILLNFSTGGIDQSFAKSKLKVAKKTASHGQVKAGTRQAVGAQTPNTQATPLQAQGFFDDPMNLMLLMAFMSQMNVGGSSRKNTPLPQSSGIGAPAFQPSSAGTPTSTTGGANTPTSTTDGASPSVYGAGNPTTGEPSGYQPLKAGEKCESIHFDCAKAEMTVNGQKRPIVCGSQTGVGKRNTNFTLKSVGTGSCKPMQNGKMGLCGKPKIVTEPLICDNCVIHVGSVSRGTHSYGCLHVTQADFNVLKSCLGKKFTMNSKNEGDRRLASTGQSPIANKGNAK